MNKYLLKLVLCFSLIIMIVTFTIGIVCEAGIYIALLRSLCLFFVLALLGNLLVCFVCKNFEV